MTNKKNIKHVLSKIKNLKNIEIKKNIIIVDHRQ